MNKQEALKILGFEAKDGEPTAESIRKNYKKKAREYHPDKHSSKSKEEQDRYAELFKALADARDFLTATSVEEITHDPDEDGVTLREEIEEVLNNMGLTVPNNISILSETDLNKVYIALEEIVEHDILDQDSCNRIFQDPEHAENYAYYFVITHLMSAAGVTLPDLSPENANKKLMEMCADLSAVHQLNEKNMAMLLDNRLDPMTQYTILKCIVALAKFDLYSIENQAFISNYITAFGSLKHYSLGVKMSGAHSKTNCEKVLSAAKQELAWQLHRDAERSLKTAESSSSATLREPPVQPARRTTDKAITLEKKLMYFEAINAFAQKFPWVFKSNREMILRNLTDALFKEDITIELFKQMPPPATFIELFFSCENASIVLNEGLLTIESLREYVTWCDGSYDQLLGIKSLLDENGLTALRKELFTLDDLKHFYGADGFAQEIKRILIKDSLEARAHKTAEPVTPQPTTPEPSRNVSEQPSSTTPRSSPPEKETSAFREQLGKIKDEKTPSASAAPPSDHPKKRASFFKRAVNYIRGKDTDNASDKKPKGPL